MTKSIYQWGRQLLADMSSTNQWGKCLREFRRIKRGQVRPPRVTRTGFMEEVALGRALVDKEG